MSYYDQLQQAQSQAASAMDCLRKLGDSLPDPAWRMVAQCAYIGLGGTDHWRPASPQDDKHG